MKEFALLNSRTKARSAYCHAGSEDRARQGCRTRASMEGFTARLMSRPGNMRPHQRGFTLVEMVAVIVLLSFGLIAGSQLFTMTAQSYRDTATRAKLTQDGRFVIERITRELREALPGSVQTSTSGSGAAQIQCIQWVPVIAASRYLTLPTASVNHFTVMEVNQTLPTGTTLYAVVFPVGDDTIYGSGNTHGSALRRLATTPINAGGELDTSTDEIYLAAIETFSASSPSERVFFTTTPVAICARDGNLLRYSNYGFVAPTILTSGVLLAENVLGGDTVGVFNVSGATLTRNAMVELDIRIRDVRTEETLRLQHTVFVRNVP